MAHNQREETLQYAERLRAFQPIEADIIMAILHTRQGQTDKGVAALESAFLGCRTDPWAWPALVKSALALAVDLGTRDAGHARRLYNALRQPFVMDFAKEGRLETLLNLSFRLDSPRGCIEVLEQLEPHIPWKRKLLEARVRCYRAGGHANSEKAQRDLDAYVGADGN